jgi:hypothetical protein
VAGDLPGLVADILTEMRRSNAHGGAPEDG